MALPFHGMGLTPRLHHIKLQKRMLTKDLMKLGNPRLELIELIRIRSWPLRRVVRRPVIQASSEKIKTDQEDVLKLLRSGNPSGGGSGSKLGVPMNFTSLGAHLRVTNIDLMRQSITALSDLRTHPMVPTNQDVGREFSIQGIAPDQTSVFRKDLKIQVLTAFSIPNNYSIVFILQPLVSTNPAI